MGDANDAPEVLERFHEHLNLVDRLAGPFARGVGVALDREDLCAYGREGLWDAARRFDPERGVPFGAYATLRIRGAMLDGVRQHSHLPRRTHERLRALEAAHDLSEGRIEDVFARPPDESAASAEKALSAHLAGMATAMSLGMIAAPEGEAGHDDPPSPEDAAARRELLELVKRGIEALPDAERALVERHYFGGERFDQVAESLGLSKSWASRPHSRAIQRLTHRLAKGA